MFCRRPSARRPTPCLRRAVLAAQGEGARAVPYTTHLSRRGTELSPPLTYIKHRIRTPRSSRPRQVTTSARCTVCLLPVAQRRAHLAGSPTRLAYASASARNPRRALKRCERLVARLLPLTLFANRLQRKRFSAAMQSTHLLARRHWFRISICRSVDPMLGAHTCLLFVSRHAARRDRGASDGACTTPRSCTLDRRVRNGTLARAHPAPLKPEW